MTRHEIRVSHGTLDALLRLASASQHVPVEIADPRHAVRRLLRLGPAPIARGPIGRGYVRGTNPRVLLRLYPDERVGPHAGAQLAALCGQADEGPVVLSAELLRRVAAAMPGGLDAAVEAIVEQGLKKVERMCSGSVDGVHGSR
jgi:hypothetical protein